MRKLCDVDEVRKCLDEVTGDDAIYAKGLLEWAIKKRTVDEADIRADEREKVLEEVRDIIKTIDAEDIISHALRCDKNCFECVECDGCLATLLFKQLEGDHKHDIADLKKREKEQTPAQKIINQVNKGELPPLSHPVGKSKRLGLGLQEFTP